MGRGWGQGRIEKCVTSTMEETCQLSIDWLYHLISSLSAYEPGTSMLFVWEYDHKFTHTIMVFLIQTNRGVLFCVCLWFFVCLSFGGGALYISLFLILRYSNSKPCGWSGTGGTLYPLPSGLMQSLKFEAWIYFFNYRRVVEKCFAHFQ